MSKKKLTDRRNLGFSLQMMSREQAGYAGVSNSLQISEVKAHLIPVKKKAEL